MLSYSAIIIVSFLGCALAAPGFNETYRIGIIVEGFTGENVSLLSTTNETAISVINEAMSLENRQRATIRVSGTVLRSNETIRLAATLLGASSAKEMYGALQKRSERAKGELIALLDTARCAASKCADLNELMTQLPGVTLITPCCFTLKSTHNHTDDEDEDKNNSHEEETQEEEEGDSTASGSQDQVETNSYDTVYNGLEPRNTVNVMLQLAKQYHWRRFHFVVSPEWTVIDNFIQEVFTYFERHKSTRNVILSKNFYCTKRLADNGICSQKNQANRLIMNKATATFVLLESTRDSVDFLREVKEQIRNNPLLANGKAVFVISLTGILAPVLGDLLTYAPDGVMVLRNKKLTFSKFRYLSFFGVPNSDPGTHLFDEVRILSKAVEVFAQNRRRFGHLSTLFCHSQFSFSESPQTILEFAKDCGNHGVTVEVWNVKHGTGNLDQVFELHGSDNWTVISEPQWVGSGPIVPVENECELEGGGYCPIQMKTLLPPTISGGIALIVVTALTIYLMCRATRKRKLQKQKERESAIANFSDLEFVKNAPEGNQKEAMPNSDSDSSATESMEVTLTNQKREFLSGCKRLDAKFHGSNVFVSNLNKSFCVADDGLVKEILQMKALRHANINPLIAVTLDPGHICALHEFCAKGTLSQVLSRKTLQLNRLFKISFISDIAAGMAYLHESAIESHGELTSENVLVDARWFCKISNIPLLKLKDDAYKIRESLPNASTSVHSQRSFVKANLSRADLIATYGSMDPAGTYSTAPELLRLPEVLRPCRGSKKGDAYSYGIIVFEVATRQNPYASYGLPDKVILSRVRAGVYPPFRPQCSPEKMPDDVHDLLELAKTCWEEVCTFRPNFPKISRLLQKMNNDKDISAKLVDEMIETMEHYAENLEATVGARTRELAEEQRRSEDLLSKMLPRTIIEELKSGRMVHPETYDSVTICFSDIVGFTNLAAESKALDIVNFLNDLYTEFDNVIDLYNVYKVETIGDAYMVASGLPIRNKTHAAEIATMSLDMLSRVTTFKIRHRPDQILQLRIGMHSGSVVAGVVGLTMPRYCLFGDTVNYASRMESSGLALRIHVSPESKALLDAAGGFHLEKRGFVTMKGKGSIETYHLIGKDGFTRPLPDLRLAASLAEHEFK